MRLYTTILLVVLCFIGQDLLGQDRQTKQELYKPFTILIIKPDTAFIADSLRVWADSIESRYISRHYYAITMLDSMKKWADEDGKRAMEERIERKKLEEMDAHNFKYYHTLANTTLFELGVLFNTQYWEKNFLSKPANIIEGVSIDKAELFSYNLTKIGQRYKVDYIVTFEDIRTDRKNGIGTLSYITTLFSTNEDKVLFKKKTEGNALVLDYKSFRQIASQKNINEKAKESEVHCFNYLDCMFTSAVRFSTEELFMVIAKKQKK